MGLIVQCLKKNKKPMTSKEIMEAVMKEQSRNNEPVISGRATVWNCLHNNCHAGGHFKLSARSKPEEHKKATYELA